MKDKEKQFKDTKSLDNAYMSLAKHYDEHKEIAIRQVRDGDFVDLLNQEIKELKENQIEEMAKLLCFQNCKHCEDCYFIKLATILYKQGYRKIDKDSVVLSREEYQLWNILKKTWASNDKEISAEDMLETLKNTKELGSKETAEKILQIIKEEYGYIGNLEKIIAKQFGVEIGE